MENLRKVLRKYLKKGTPGSLGVDTNFKEEEEVAVCQKKIQEIETLLGLLALPSSGTDVAKVKRKLGAVLCHTSDRIKRIGSGAEGQPDLEIEIENCITKFQKLAQCSLQANISGRSDTSLSEAEGGINMKTKISHVSSQDVRKLNTLVQDNFSSSDSLNTETSKKLQKRAKSRKKKHHKQTSSSDTDKAKQGFKKKSRSKMKKIMKMRKTSTSPSDTDNEDQKKSRRLKATPVRFWNLRFSGDDNTSVGAFLADVEDRRVANNMSFRELFQAAGELFTGLALAVYRSCRGRIDDWHGLEVKLRSAFQDPDYDRR